MRSPKNMNIIQIDITNACIRECSNCTRFCGHHKKPYFMELDMVKKAVDSLEGFPGTIGIMGGEPTLHPQFEDIARYVGSKYNNKKEEDILMQHPQEQFMQTVLSVKNAYGDFVMHNGMPDIRVKSPGLWSAMGEKYLEHFEVIQDVFKMQVLNDHGNEMYHDPLLVSRKELGIPDDEWEVLRDACWIQNEWSASITPKGAFFCEVAGTLDLLLDGPGGWEVTKDWWKREVSDFKDQLHWCEFCGAACRTYTRNANEEVDDVSPLIYEKLKMVGSKKIDHGKIHLMQIGENGVDADANNASKVRFEAVISPYTDGAATKFTKQSKLYPKAFEAIVMPTQPLSATDQEMYSELFFSQFQTTFFLFETEEAKVNFAMPHTEKWIAYCVKNKDDIKELLTLKKHGIFLAVFSENLVPKIDFVSQLSEYVMNPGALLYTKNVIDNALLQRFVTVKGDGEFLIFNRAASSLKICNHDFANITHIADVKKIWNTEKMVIIDEKLFSKTAYTQINQELRYAMYGTGIRGRKNFHTIREEGGTITCVFDSDIEKQGTNFEGIVIDSPKNIIKRRDEFDSVIISSHTYYVEMKNELLECGFKEDELLYYLPRV